MLNREQTAGTNDRYMDATVVYQRTLSSLRSDETNKSKEQMSRASLVHFETAQRKVGHVTKVSAVTPSHVLTTLTRNNANTAEADIKG